MSKEKLIDLLRQRHPNTLGCCISGRTIKCTVCGRGVKYTVSENVVDGGCTRDGCLVLEKEELFPT